MMNDKMNMIAKQASDDIEKLRQEFEEKKNEILVEAEKRMNEAEKTMTPKEREYKVLEDLLEDLPDTVMLNDGAFDWEAEECTIISVLAKEDEHGDPVTMVEHEIDTPAAMVVVSLIDALKHATHEMFCSEGLTLSYEKIEEHIDKAMEKAFIMMSANTIVDSVLDIIAKAGEQND